MTTPVTIGKAKVRYIDVCSGISAPTAAWKPLGWQALCYAEIENAPRAVLTHHYPDVPVRGDFTEIKGTEYGPVDLLVGGTPCQSFSIAGLRGGLADDRGNLALEYLRLADRARPRWLVWENVPGVLSSNGGRDFGAILGGMAELGYGFAYRVLDAQHFGVPQRRRRVFVVGYLGDWRPPAAVLIERHGLQANTPPQRPKGSQVAGTFGATSHDWSRANPGDYDSLVVFDPTQITSGKNFSNPKPGDPMHPLARTSHPPVIAFSIRGREGGAVPEAAGDGLVPSIRTNGGGGSHVFLGSASGVRKMTPREVERCFGYQDDFTLVPYRGRMMADGPRYKMLGNSMAVPVMRWIGERIAKVEALSQAERQAA